MVIALSESIATEVVSGDLSVIVLPALGPQSLSLSVPTAVRAEFDEFDLGDTDDESNDERKWHRYQWPLPLHMVRLASRIKNMIELSTVLHEAACVLFGPEEAFKQTEHLEASAPSDRIVLAWQIRFDWLSMLWDRELLAMLAVGTIVDRHLGADQSPRCGYQFLCAREEAYFTTEDQAAYACLLTAWHFTTRRLPPTAVGHGNSSADAIVYRMVYSLLLVAGDLIDLYRRLVRSCLTDQSKERKVTSALASVIHHVAYARTMTEVDSESSELLFPDALGVLDHLHILFNALESAITALPWRAAFREQLCAILEVFGQKKHRDRFLEKCGLPGFLERRFKTFRVKRLTWRWEILEIILSDVLDSSPFLAYFDVQRMVGPQKISTAVYKDS